MQNGWPISGSRNRNFKANLLKSSCKTITKVLTTDINRIVNQSENEANKSGSVQVRLGWLWCEFCQPILTEHSKENLNQTLIKNHSNA